MLKKEIQYENFDGQTVTETFHFHLSKAELLRMEVAAKGGLQKEMEALVAAEDGAAIMAFLEKFIKTSVGKKSPDGSRFLKSDEIVDDFVSSPAYDELFMGLCTDPIKAAEFLNGVVPKGIAEDARKIAASQNKEATVANLDEARENLKREEPGPEVNISDPSEGGNVFTPPSRPIGLTPTQAREMDSEQLRSGLASGRYILVSGE